MATSALAKKLRLPDAQRAIILNAPEGYLMLLGEPPEGVEVGQVSIDKVWSAMRSQPLERVGKR